MGIEWKNAGRLEPGDQRPKPANAPCFAADTRPRFNYRIPDGGIVAVIYDHGELPKTEIGYQTIGGKVVAARLVSLTPHYPDGHERDLNGCIVRARGNAAADDAQAALLDESPKRWSRAALRRECKQRAIDDALARVEELRAEVEELDGDDDCAAWRPARNAAAGVNRCSRG